MTDRSLFGFFGGIELGKKNTNKGLPQGSILSPILFNIYISDIIFKIDYRCKLISFADDILIYCSDKEIKIILEKLPFSANQVDDWLLDLNLLISVDKSRLMILSHNKVSCAANEFEVQIGNNILKNCLCIRYLGIYIDAKLKWDVHIRFLQEKTRKLIGMFRMICKIDKGMHPLMGIKVYKQFVRPSLDWGGFLIQESEKKFLEMFDVIQNAAIRSSIGCIRTTPINVLLHVAGIDTLKFRREILTKKFISRQVAHKDSLLIPKLKLLEEKFDRNKKVPEYKIPYLYKCWMSNKKFFGKIYRNQRCIAYMIPYRIQFSKLDINFDLGKEIKSSRKPVTVFNKYFSNNNNRLDILVYTDGSKTDKGVGFAVYSPKMIELKGRINKLNSIYNAETYGILYALKWIRDNDLDKVGIFTDSLCECSGEVK